MGITRRKSAADIDARITAVEDLHFSNTESQAFKAAMKAAAEQMDDDLYKAFDSKTHVLPFLADTLDYSTTILSDQWNWREEARFKTIAVSNCQVERMPWEKLLWGSTVARLVSGFIVRPEANHQGYRHPVSGCGANIGTG